MLGDNLKRIRKERGFTQEELKPNQTQRFALTVSRSEAGKWTVTDWHFQSD